MKKQLTTRQVRSVLYSLGDSAVKVAKSLKRRKITGKLGDGYSCPVANFLQKKLKNTAFVASYVEVAGLNFKTSRTIQRFINRFDKGDFPYLMQQG